MGNSSARRIGLRSVTILGLRWPRTTTGAARKSGTSRLTARNGDEKFGDPLPTAGRAPVEMIARGLGASGAPSGLRIAEVSRP